MFLLVSHFAFSDHPGNTLTIAVGREDICEGQAILLEKTKTHCYVQIV